MSFFPELWLARRLKIVSILKAHSATTVLDLGCGPGAVLEILASPALYLDQFPSKEDLELQSIDLPLEEHELHLEKLMGLDLRKESILQAVEQVSIVEHEDRTIYDRERYEPLSVELFEGSLVDFNVEFENLDAIFATEVIEHLPAEVLDLFAPMVLGRYQPKVLILSTPNYSFNPYFTSSSNTSHQFLEPSGRTGRVFRDNDHQFEWTESEFEAYCSKVAVEYDYEVTFDGVGSLKNYYFPDSIPFPPPSLSVHPELKDAPTSIELPENPSKFYATQFAIFTGKLITPNVPIMISIQEPNPTKHISIAKIDHLPLSTSPSSSQDILDCVQELMKIKLRSNSETLSHLFDSSAELRLLVGGDIGRIFRAVKEETDSWSWKLIEGEKGPDAVLITCFGFELSIDRDDDENRFQEIEENSSDAISSEEEEWGAGIGTEQIKINGNIVNEW